MPRSIFCRSRFWAIELLRDGQRLRHVARQQQAQRFLRRFQPPGGVQARGELEADFVRAERRRALGDLFQRHQAGPLRVAQPFQSGGNENAVFADERHEVGNRAERDEIEQRAQIEFRRAGQTDFASALDQGVGEFEGEAGGAEFGESRLRV